MELLGAVVASGASRVVRAQHCGGFQETHRLEFRVWGLRGLRGLGFRGLVVQGFRGLGSRVYYEGHCQL